MNTKQYVINALVAAIYVAVTAAFSMLSFGAIQFRLAEMLNHLAVFNKKYIIGILAGVILSNLFFSPAVALDLVFGTAHSLIALLAMRFLTRKMTDPLPKMFVNAAMFALFSFIIAAELHWAFGAPFWFSFITVALGELAVMIIGAPIMLWIDRHVNFDQQMKD